MTVNGVVMSASMIQEAGAELVIIGHSERRTLFGETDATVNRKIGAAFASALTPIVCIGETLAQRDGSETLAVLDRQIKQGFDGLTADQIGALVIAYEPVWAIGTGKTATPELAQQAHEVIKALHDTRVLYGGSVKPENAAELLSQSSIDGALVGGASLEPDSFAAICRAASTS